MCGTILSIRSSEVGHYFNQIEHQQEIISFNQLQIDCVCAVGLGRYTHREWVDPLRNCIAFRRTCSIRQEDKHLFCSPDQRPSNFFIRSYRVVGSGIAKLGIEESYPSYSGVEGKMLRQRSDYFLFTNRTALSESCSSPLKEICLLRNWINLFAIFVNRQHTHVLSTCEDPRFTNQLIHSKNGHISYGIE